MSGLAGKSECLRIMTTILICTTIQFPMYLTQRNPSASWEPLPLDPTGQAVVWVWFRPATAPDGIVFSVPAQLFGSPIVSQRLTVRQLLATAAIESPIAYFIIGGQSFDAAGGTSPMLDSVLAPAAGGNNLDVTVMTVPMMPMAWPQAVTPGPDYAAQQAQTAAYAPSGSGVDAQLLDAMDSVWNGVVQLEVRVSSLRKDLGGAVARISSLNRDLTSHERLACDSKDLAEWSDARRWLRDSLSVLQRAIKEIDVGTTSGAGKRNRFEEIYQNHVVPRIPLPGLMQVVNEFESYRKILQGVVASSQAALSKAGRDAESRANSVLQRIGTKVRARKK